ncbi:GDP-L-fucose synthase family protein [Altererythrobacter sp. CAU 1778]
MAALPFELAGRRVYVAGDRGMVGSAIVRRLAREDCEVLTTPRSLDLREQAAVGAWFAAEKPEAVFLAAARVGGIAANDAHPAQFLYDNLMLQANVIESARASGVAKLLFLGSSCIYPRDADQPLTEDALLTGPLEPTNQWYAIAKIAGIKLCDAYRREHGCDFISAMPTNLYGPGDNYDPATSHVLPALIAKVHAAKVAGADSIAVWGSGTPLREFLHVDDLADACVLLIREFTGEGPVNVGSGEEVTIAHLAGLVCAAAGFEGAIHFDPSKPDGTPRKLLDSSRLAALGWAPRIALAEGIAAELRTYAEGANVRRVRLDG